jgi:hypothetical protein
MADILIYGGELPGCAAAICAARHAGGDREVVLCFPEPVPGGAATLGGLCAWERRLWTHGGRRADPQGGSFARWLEAVGPVFDPDTLTSLLRAELADAGVRVLPGRELLNAIPASAPGRGGRSRARRGRRGAPTALAAVRLGDAAALAAAGEAAAAEAAEEEIAARVFVDASATGRLARLAGVPLSPGRADWDADGRQMAATLLVQVDGIDWDTLTSARDAAEKPVWGVAREEGASGGRRVFWGGRQVAASDPLLAAFAEAHPGIRVGPLRGWEGSGESFWLQCLLLYDVDARRRAYDAGTERDVEPVPAGSLDLDSAWRQARAIAGGPDLLGCLRRFPGLERVRVLRDGDGAPRTGGVLVVRESAHAMAAGPEPFAVRVEDVTGAGAQPGDGVDWRHRPRRIGLGFYWMEDYGYTAQEVAPPLAAAANPCYLPLDALLCPPLENLLVAGHAARIESRAWWALRTLPNQCVLGDAAGVAAACSLREDVPVLRFSNPEVAAVQAWLGEEDAILEKW